MTKLTTAKTDLEKEVQNIINEEAEGNVDAYIEDLRQHGCVSGMVRGLLYYKDTCDFYRRHEDEIWNLIVDTQENLGYMDPFSFLAMLNGAKNVRDVTTFKNLLAWFAFEETASKLYDRELVLKTSRKTSHRKTERHP